jgi:hypothetical protein
MGPEVEATVATCAPVIIRTTVGMTIPMRGAGATSLLRPIAMLIAIAVSIQAVPNDCHCRRVLSAFSSVEPPLVVTHIRQPAG